MNREEYNKLFHELQLNLVAFNPLLQCDQEVLKLVNAAIEAEREACAKVCDAYDVAEDVCSSDTAEGIALAIRARGQQ